MKFHLHLLSLVLATSSSLALVAPRSASEDLRSVARQPQPQPQPIPVPAATDLTARYLSSRGNGDDNNNGNGDGNNSGNNNSNGNDHGNGNGNDNGNDNRNKQCGDQSKVDECKKRGPEWGCDQDCICRGPPGKCQDDSKWNECLSKGKECGEYKDMCCCTLTVLCCLVTMTKAMRDCGDIKC